MSSNAPAREAEGLPGETSVTQHSSLLSDAALSTFGAVGGTLISGVASILIARGLGVTNRGRWAVISSLAVLVATLAAVGLPMAAAYGAARLRSDERTRLVQAALVGAVAFGAFAAACYLLLAIIVRPPDSTLAVALGCAIPFSTVLYAVAHQLTLTIASMRWFALAQLTGAVLTLVAVVTLYAAGALTVVSVVLISAGGSLAGALVSAAAVWRAHSLQTWLLNAAADVIRVLRPYLAYALITFATLSLTQVVQRVDVLLVNGYKGPHSAGLYAVAVQVTDLMLVVPAGLGLVMFRRGACSVPAHYRDARIVLRWTGLFGLLAALIALVAAAWAIPLVFGTGYRGSVEPLRLLLPGTLAFSLQSVLSQYLAGRGRPRVVLIAWLLGAITGITADLIVIPRYGIAGAAVVSSASYILVTGLHFQALQRIRPGRSAPA